MDKIYQQKDHREKKYKCSASLKIKEIKTKRNKMFLMY